jgi:hypothetical protein
MSGRAVPPGQIISLRNPQGSLSLGTMNEAEGHWPKIKIGTHETGLDDLRRATPEDLEASLNAPTTVRPDLTFWDRRRQEREAWERSQVSERRTSSLP